MPSALKARVNRPSYREMRTQLDALRKPAAKMLEDVFNRYYEVCMASDPPRKAIEVTEPGINWKALIMSLPQQQSRKVLGAGIRKILLAETDCVHHGIYRFHVVRLDGSSAVFDYREAYDDPYHSYKEKSFAHDVELALRAGILHQLVEFKEMLSKDSQMELVSHISGLALPWEKAVVQHFPVTFTQMVDHFLNEHQLTLEQVKLEFCEDHGYRIKDQALLDQWRLYHRSRAHYRVISTDEAMEQDHL